jgi:hypothetical protein
MDISGAAVAREPNQEGRSRGFVLYISSKWVVLFAYDVQTQEVGAVNFAALGVDGAVNLQSTLSTSSVIEQGEPVRPHHPITCPSELTLEEDGTFSCEHASVPPGDVRTQLCLDHTVALLLIELSQSL